ncbi:hypothetical protein BDR03DRAFT_988084 [Suillus americanus]|nr:hypothetical protein BDR03DRAFT_988084 [Suillus americanus]
MSTRIYIDSDIGFYGRLEPVAQKGVKGKEKEKESGKNLQPILVEAFGATDGPGWLQQLLLVFVTAKPLIPPKPKLRALQSLSLDLTTSSSWDTLPQVQFSGFQDLKLLNLSARTVEHALNFFRSLQIIRTRGISFDFAPHLAESSASESAMLSQFFAIL